MQTRNDVLRLDGMMCTIQAYVLVLTRRRGDRSGIEERGSLILR